MPRLHHTIEDLEEKGDYIKFASCDYVGCTNFFTVARSAQCSKCKRLFCVEHEDDSFIHQHDSDTDTDDENTYENKLSGVGCVMCCKSPKYAHLRVFDDKQIIAYLMGTVIKTKTKVEILNDMRNSLNPAASASTVVSTLPTVDDLRATDDDVHLFESLRFSDPPYI